MCTEFILAFLYFLILLIINYFLFRFILSSFSNYLLLLKLKNILLKFPIQKAFLFYNFYFYLKDKKINKTFLKNFHTLSRTNDTLIIGNIYKKLFSISKEGKSKQISLDYFLKLLETQFLFP